MPRLEDENVPNSKVRKTSWFALAFGSIVVLCLFAFVDLKPQTNFSPRCEILPKLVPQTYAENNETVSSILHDPEFRKASAKKLSSAVQVPTEVYDGMPPVEEAPEFWSRMGKFHDYLLTTFPSVHSKLDVAKVNTYGLVYTWKGSDESLKPIMLTAHMDVVPVQNETISRWAYPPFEGHYDGKLMFGRGVVDCKNLLVGLMESVELLLKEDFQPKRTILLAFGFDEESSGTHGASSIGKYLEDKYGPDSLYLILDEGGGQLEKHDATTYIASPNTSEKGYMDMVVELTTPGGHSSVPPDHTSIGMMSELVRNIESDPFESILSSRNPTLQYLECLAEHSDSMDSDLKTNILKAAVDKAANSKVIKYIETSRLMKYLIRTSQSVDIVNGGAKANALPEHVSVLVNHRISVESSIEETAERFVGRVSKIANKYNVGLVDHLGKELLASTANGHFNLSILTSSEPAPISSTESDVWKLYSGVLRHLYEDLVFQGSLAKPVIIAPSVPTGNTDTRHYLNLTNNIYRSMPGYSTMSMMESGLHSVNEKIEFDFHLHIIAFYYQYMHVLDESF